MKYICVNPRMIVLWTVVAMLAVGAAGCATRYVADYDAQVVEDVNQISRKIDIFFGKLMETPAEERGYRHFKDAYIEVEADLRLLLRRNEIRPLNDETTRQIHTTLKLWQDDKAKHEKKNTVSNFIAKKHREQFCRLFVAMAKGEMAKKMVQH